MKKKLLCSFLVSLTLSLLVSPVLASSIVQKITVDESHLEAEKTRIFRLGSL